MGFSEQCLNSGHIIYLSTFFHSCTVEYEFDNCPYNVIFSSICNHIRILYLKRHTAPHVRAKPSQAKFQGHYFPMTLRKAVVMVLQHPGNQPFLDKIKENNFSEKAILHNVQSCHPDAHFKARQRANLMKRICTRLLRRKYKIAHSFY